MGEYICHHGIKGQRWGVRRFQRKDGRYTEAGKKRYADNPNTGQSRKPESDGPTEKTQSVQYLHVDPKLATLSDDDMRKVVNRGELERKYKATLAGKNPNDNEHKKGPSKELARAKIAAGVAGLLAKQYKDSLDYKRQHKPRMKLDEMSDDEIREKVDRYRLETSYNDIFAPSNVSRGEERINQFLALAAASATLGVTIYEMREKKNK